jgi:hypothetical protein
MNKETVTLNIGLLTNDEVQCPVSLALVWPILDALFPRLDGEFRQQSYSYRLAKSETEETLVVEVQANVCDLARTLRYACFWLHQDCIAVQLPDGSGQLVGPKAEEWGDFNPAYFLPLK